MNTLQSSLVLAVLAIIITPLQCASFDSTIGVPGMSIEELPASYLLESASCGNMTGPICANDCRSLLACVGDQEPAHVETCEESNRDNRYCVGKRCQATPDHHNAECLRTQLRCTSDGVFPDPYDCTSYYSCINGLNSMPYRFRCPANYVYSSRMKLCFRNVDYSTCDVVNCTGVANKFIPFIQNSAYYAFCGVPAIMFKCADEVNYKFDQSLNDCVYNCQGTGYFVDPSNCAQFYICESAGAEAILQRCPLGFKFDGWRCVESRSCINIPATTTMMPTATPTIQP